MGLYSSIEKNGDKYEVKLANRTVQINDDAPYLEYFAAKKCVKGFMADEKVWGEDLTKLAGFAEAVVANVKAILNGEVLL